MNKPEVKRRGRPPKKAQEMYSEWFLRKIAVDVEGKEWDQLSRDDVDRVSEMWKRGEGSRRM